MKKAIIILLSITINLIVQAAQAQTNWPAYESGQYYLWATNQAAIAQAALQYVNVNSGFFPIYERRSGVINSNKIAAARWVDALEELKDGRFGFPAIPPKLLDQIGVPSEGRNLFLITYLPELIVVTADMRKEEED